MNGTSAVAVWISADGALPAGKRRRYAVEFEPAHTPGYFGLAGMEIELSEKLGREVDLRTPRELSKHFRDKVVAGAAVLYERP